jgi:DNA-directed RNA polymerase specialized sigma24 family protein
VALGFGSTTPGPLNGPVEIERLEARLVLERLLSCLTDCQREVVALYEIGELSADEVARAVGCTPPGVRSIARDARIRLSEAARGSRFEKEMKHDR